MTRVLRSAGPELAGLIILGATIGAVAGGAGMAGLPSHVAPASAAGAILLPMLCQAPWARLLRRRDGAGAQGST